MAGLRNDQLIRAEMALLLITLFLIPLIQTFSVSTQQLDFWVLKTSVEKEQNEALRQRNAYFLTGHSLQMLCTYVSNGDKDYCALRNSTNLTVYPSGSQKDKALIQESMVILEQTKCNLTVEFRNVTTEFQGPYQCDDLMNPGKAKPRTFEIGEAPVYPSNISIVYTPMDNIMLLLDPVKTGSDLNAPHTDWEVVPTWGTDSELKCLGTDSDKMCKDLSPDGLCRLCVIKLKRYALCGQYNNQGHISFPVDFSIKVVNKFGTASQQSPASFSLPAWVKPGPVDEITVRRTTPSRLVLRVSAPKNVDQAHFLSMNSTTGFALQYTVSLLSARDQSLMLEDNKRFYHTYGFVRNLQDDEEALNNSLAVSRFPYISQLMAWNSSKPQCSARLRRPVLQVQNLPFAGYHYSVSVVSKARYWGSPVLLNPELAKTKETAPVEGPGLQYSFAYCPPSRQGLCGICVVYFKEIPQLKRGGVVVNHTLSLRLSNESQISSPAQMCSNSQGVELSTGGSSNTFLVTGLAVGGIYDVHLQAHTQAGASPVTARTLHVHSAPPAFAPTNIVIEKFGISYDLSWKPGNASNTMYVHYCYTTPLEMQDRENITSNGTTEADLPLNCTTNMVTKVLSDNSPSSYIFDDIQFYNGLTPAFFISSVGPEGDHSGLQSVDCFYTRRKFPKPVDQHAVTVQASEGDPTALVVKFSLDCGNDLNHRDGRPYRFAIGVVKDDGHCKEHCSAAMARSNPFVSRIQGSLKDLVVHTFTDLQLGTSYCVGVNVAGDTDDFRSVSWRCMTGATQQQGRGSGDKSTGVIVGVVFGVLVAVAVYPFENGQPWNLCKVSHLLQEHAFLVVSGDLASTQGSCVGFEASVGNHPVKGPADVVKHEWLASVLRHHPEIKKNRVCAVGCFVRKHIKMLKAKFKTPLRQDEFSSAQLHARSIDVETKGLIKGVDNPLFSRDSVDILESSAESSSVETQGLEADQADSWSTSYSEYSISSPTPQEQVGAIPRYSQQNGNFASMRETAGVNRDGEATPPEEESENNSEEEDDGSDEVEEVEQVDGDADVDNAGNNAADSGDTAIVPIVLPPQQCSAAEEDPVSGIDAILSAAGNASGQQSHSEVLSLHSITFQDDSLSSEGPGIDQILQAVSIGSQREPSLDRQVGSIEDEADIQVMNHAIPQRGLLQKREAVETDVNPQATRDNARNQVSKALGLVDPQTLNGSAFQNFSHAQNSVKSSTDVPTTAVVSRNNMGHSVPNENGCSVNIEDSLPFSPQENGLAVNIGEMLPLDSILKAAEGCPWKSTYNSDCQGSAPQPRRMDSTSERDSLHIFSGQESGFDTDIDMESSAESNVETSAPENLASSQCSSKPLLNGSKITNEIR